jgi:protein-L-isoaspartate(D-aspartate) O-methyltransferase
MDKFKKKRLEMVKSQLQSRGIRDKRVLSVMSRIPRHLFAGEDMREGAYGDSPVPAGEGQTISQPYMVALMTECLRLEGSEKVLEIGTGSGYQTAILAELAERVYTVERIEKLSRSAESVLRELGYENIAFRVGDGSEGWHEHAPYDRIIVTAAAPDVPSVLAGQLSEGGRMVIPVGGRGLQELKVLKKEGGKLQSRNASGCVFVPLIGKYGHGHSD